jgi:hypothetical protein
MYYTARAGTVYNQAKHRAWQLPGLAENSIGIG